MPTLSTQSGNCPEVIGNPVFSGNASFSVSTIAAAGTNQGTAAAVPAADRINVTGSDGTKGVVLPTMTVGQDIILSNNSASAMLVYPFTGAAIDNNAANASLSVSARKTVRVWCYSATQLFSQVGA